MLAECCSGRTDSVGIGPEPVPGNRYRRALQEGTVEKTQRLRQVGMSASTLEGNVLVKFGVRRSTLQNILNELKQLNESVQPPQRDHTA